MTKQMAIVVIGSLRVKTYQKSFDKALQVSIHNLGLLSNNKKKNLDTPFI